MSGPRIPIEVDTSGIDRALQQVEQRTKRTWRAINEGAPGGGGGSFRYAPGAGLGAMPGSAASQVTKEQIAAERKLTLAIEALTRYIGRPSRAQASSLVQNFDALAGSGAYGTRRLGGYSGGLGDWLNNYRSGYLHDRDANRHFQDVARRIGLNVPNAGGGAAWPYRMLQRVAPMFGGAGGAIGNAAGAAAGSGLGAMGMAGRFLGGAGIGAAMYAGYKVFQGVGESGNEAVGYADLRAKLGPLTTDFDHLRESVRHATRGMGITYEEAQRIAAGFVRTANLQGEMAGELNQEVKNAAGFGRGFGMEPAQASEFFAQMRHYGVTGNADDSRRMAVMIGESVAKGGNTAKADEVLAAISNFTSIAARQSLAAPNVEGFASMLASMTGLRLPGMDPSGAANTLGKINGALAGGGASGEASQNFSLGLYQRALPNFDALDMGVLGSVGAFGTVTDAFGEGSAAYMAADEATRARYRGYTAAGGDRRLIDMQLEGLRGQYGHNYRMYREAGARHFGLSSVEFSAFDVASRQDGGIGGLLASLEKSGIKTSGLNTKSIAALAQLQNGGESMLMDQAKRLTELTGGDALSLQEKGDLADAQKEGGEKLREVVMRLTAQHDTVKDEGTRTRESITDVKNAIQDFSVKLLPLVNTIREAVVEVARWAAPNSNFVKGLDAEKDRISGIERNGRSAIAGFDDGLAKLRAAADKETDPKKKAALLDNISSLESGRALSLKKLREEAAVSGNAELPDSYRKWLEGSAGGAASGGGSVQDKIRAEAERQGVPPEIALALAKQESGFRADARGVKIKSGMHKGDSAYGVYQYMGKTAEAKGFDRFDVDQNIRHGVADLKKHYQKFGSWEKAIAAHHAGPGAVANGVPGGGDGLISTRRYTDNVMKMAGLLNSGGESGPVPGAGTPAAGSGPSKSVVESIITLLDQNGNQRHDPIVQTHFGAPRPAGF